MVHTPNRHLPKHVVILGAGPAGLAVGHELSANGVKVTVLERNSYVGGLCRTVKHDGYKFDLGGHRWFTKNEDLNNWFRRLMAGEIVMVERISRIYHDGKFFNYPIAVGDIVKKMHPLTVLHAGLSFIAVALRQSISAKPITNMKEAYTAQFGSKLYEEFFRCYSEKVWGRPCEELSADWVTQRSKGLSIWSLVSNALMSPKSKAVSLIDEFMYPRDGYVRIPERMAEDVEHCGGQILLNSSVTRAVYHGPNDIEVFYDDGGKSGSVRANAVVSTIPLGIFASLIEPGSDDRVERAAKALKFRDLITVNLCLKRKQVTPDTWLYVQDQDILFGRIHEPKNWSKAMSPDDDHTSLVLECFCSRGDHIWELSDDNIAERCIDDLVDKLKFIDRSEVDGWKVIRTIQAYPVYDLQYKENIEIIHNYLHSYQGMHIVGRGGAFRYNNADHSIEMGLLLGRYLLGDEINYMDVNTEDEYHEEIKSAKPKREYYHVD